MQRRKFLGKVAALIGVAALVPVVKAEANAFDGYAEGENMCTRFGYAEPIAVNDFHSLDTTCNGWFIELDPAVRGTFPDQGGARRCLTS